MADNRPRTFIQLGLLQGPLVRSLGNARAGDELVGRNRSLA